MHKHLGGSYFSNDEIQSYVKFNFKQLLICKYISNNVVFCVQRNLLENTKDILLFQFFFCIFCFILFLANDFKAYRLKINSLLFTFYFFFFFFLISCMFYLHDSAMISNYVLTLFGL